MATDNGSVPRFLWLPGLIFTSLLILFLIVAFVVYPNLTPDQRSIVFLLFALLAGFSTLFLGGTALLQFTGDTWIGAKIGGSATAGVAVFLICYLVPPHIFPPQPPLNGVTITPADKKKLVERQS